MVDTVTLEFATASGPVNITTADGQNVTIASGEGGVGNNSGGALFLESGDAWDEAEGPASGGLISLNAGIGGPNGGHGGTVEINGGDAQATDGNGGSVSIYLGTSGGGSGVVGHLLITNLAAYADDAAAATGGVPVGGVYRTASALKIRVA